MSIRSNFDPRRADQRVVFQRSTQTRSSTSGEFVDGWADLKEAWAAVDGDKASEANVEGGIRSVAGYTVWVRADIVTRFSIGERDRISWNGQILNIKALPNQQLRGRWMPITCDAGLNAG